MPRSSNGSGSRAFTPQIGVRFPYGVLKTERSEAWLSRLVGGQEIAGSNPAVLTDKTIGQRCQMVARLLWEQEGLGSTPGCPTQAVVEGWLPRHG